MNHSLKSKNIHEATFHGDAGCTDPPLRDETTNLCKEQADTTDTI